MFMESIELLPLGTNFPRRRRRAEAFLATFPSVCGMSLRNTEVGLDFTNRVTAPSAPNGF